MKVAIIASGIPDENNPIGGLFAYDQAKALRDQGCEITYCIVDLRSIRKKRSLGLNRRNENGIDIISFAIPIGPIDIRIRDWIGEKALKHILRIVIREIGRPDIIHAHFLDMGVISATVSEYYGIPLVITEHSSQLHNNNIKTIDVSRAQKCYGVAKTVISVSEALKNSIKRLTGIDSIVIPNIVKLETSAKKRENKKKEVFTFASAGGLVKDKGFELLLYAFSDITKLEKNFRLIIMGDGPEKEKLHNLARALEINDFVEFTGAYVRPQFVEKMNSVDAFILPSLHETFGVVYVEAMLCGIPVIATRCGGPQEFVNETNGILIEPNNRSETAEAMLKIRNLINNNMYNSEGIATSAKEKYGAKSISDQIISVYRRIINE